MMRKVLLALVLIMGASPAFASMTCWYNESGIYSGMDSTPITAADIAVGQARQLQDSGAYAWAYNIDGTDCPADIPADAFVQAAGDDSNPLTCWYNENLVFSGADSGNYGAEGTQVGQASKVGESGDYTWAYIIGEWTDGNSCPAEIPASAFPG